MNNVWPLLTDNNDDFNARLLWEGPDIDMLIDFLVYYLHWEPRYIRQHIFPMLSTNFLRDMASSPTETLLHGQYEFDSIQRVKVRYGHQVYVIRWRKSSPTPNDINNLASSEECLVESVCETEETRTEGSSNDTDELDVAQVYVDGESSFLLTDENMELVQTAFPAEVDCFRQQKVRPFS